MPNEWDRPYTPWFRDGDDDIRVVFAAVGEALTAWEELESFVANLFASLTGSANQMHLGPAIRAFGVVNSAKMRAQMLTLAAEAFFRNLTLFFDDDPSDAVVAASTEIRNVIKAYGGWSDRRNDVAHGVVRDADNPGDEEFETPGAPVTHLLYPSESNTKKWPALEPPHYNYNSEEILAFAEGFRSLRMRVEALIDAVEEINVLK